MKKIIKLIYALEFSIIISFFLVIFIELKAVLLIFFTLFLISCYIIYKEKIGQELIIALLFALIVTSYFIYKYTTLNIIVGRINLFPLISWTTGLVLLREIYEKLKIKNKFLLISIIYIIALFILEYIGYYALQIRLNSNFPSLLGLGIMHAPIEMKLFYIFAGPVYILITNYLKVK